MAIRFEIYRDGQRLARYEPVAATALGPESVPIAGEVGFRDGLLVIENVDDPAVGLALLWDAGPAGQFLLETTRLAQRDRPYVLNVELARSRLMRVVQKQEDWNLFDFPRADRFTARFREAQTMFADALGKLDEPALASQLADAALEIAIGLSEELAMFHAELLINRRKQTGQFVKHVVGCKADTAIRSDRYKDLLAGQFDYAVVPMNWKALQPQEGLFETEATDEWVEYLGRRRVPVIAGPMVCWEEDSVPEWLFVWENDFDTLRELAYEYVHRVVHRYRRGVSMWNVAAGLHKRNSFGLSFEQVIELTRLLVAQVKTIIPNARTLVTITHAFGEEGPGRHPQAVPPIMYAEMAAQAGINFEAFGLELEMGVPAPGRFNRDLFQLSSLLDRFSTLGRPVFITGIGAPGRNTPDPDDPNRIDPAAAGRWKRPWDPKVQAEWVDAVYHLCMSKPYVESIAWSNLADINPTVPGGGLFDDTLQPKPAFQKVQELREKFKGWSKKG